MPQFTLYPGDCLQVLAGLPENSVDAVVCDPPYGLGFMGKHWDDAQNIAFQAETWAAVLRVLKPGGHLIAFSGARTYHRMVVAIEDAGFEVRDQLAWVYGSGFPKSLDVSKALDKAAGCDREKIAVGKPVKRIIPGADQNNTGSWIKDSGREYQPGVEIPATEEARNWEGWGTALKPAWEPICLARKPLSEKTIAANVLRWGTGALNIDATRVATGDKLGGGGEKAETAGKFTNDGWRRPWMDDPVKSAEFAAKVRANVEKSEALGRWPANLCHDGSEEVLVGFPDSKGQQGDVRGTEQSRTGDENTNCYGEYGRVPFAKRSDSGSAARFFYCAKANAKDRIGSKHPTVKPVALMRWLVRMVTPPNGTVLDPFAGTGTTGQAALEEGFDATLIEREEEYQTDIRRRLAVYDEPRDWLDSFMADAEDYLDAK